MSDLTGDFGSYSTIPNENDVVNNLAAYIQGTTNEINVTNNGNAVVLSTPQRIDTGANFVVNSAQITGLTANSFVTTDGKSNLTTTPRTISDSIVSADVSGNLQNTTLSNNNTNGITGQLVYSAGNLLLKVSGTQNFDTNGSPTWVTVNLTNVLSFGASLSGDKIYLWNDGVGDFMAIGRNSNTVYFNINDASPNKAFAFMINGSSILNIIQTITSALVGTDASNNLVPITISNANGCNFSYSPNTLTCTLTQDLRSTASPTWVGLNLTGLTASSIVTTDASKNLTTQVIVNANGCNVSIASNGTITFSMAQDVRVTASPSWNNITLSQFAGVGEKLIAISNTGLVEIVNINNSNGCNISLSAASLNCTLQQDISSSASPTWVGVTLTGNLTMNNTTNEIIFGTSLGTRLLLFPNGGGGADYTVGIAASTLAYNVPTGGKHSFQVNGTEIGNISGGGAGLFLGSTNGITCGAISSFGNFTNRTNSMTTGAVSCGSITSTDFFNNGTNSMTTGSVSCGSISAGTNSITCGAITASGTISCGTNSATCGSLTSGNTTNQLILGTTKTTTISATQPSASLTYTVPDQGANDTFAFISQFSKRATLWADEMLVTSAGGGYLSPQTTTSQLYNQYSGFSNSNVTTLTFSSSFAVAAGTYQFELLASSDSDSAIITWSVDGSIIGTTDLYSASQVFNTFQTITNTKVLTAGYHTLIGANSSKNGSSSANRIRITKVFIHRASGD